MEETSYSLTRWSSTQIVAGLQGREAQVVQDGFGFVRRCLSGERSRQSLGPVLLRPQMTWTARPSHPSRPKHCSLHSRPDNFGNLLVLPACTPGSRSHLQLQQSPSSCKYPDKLDSLNSADHSDSRFRRRRSPRHSLSWPTLSRNHLLPAQLSPQQLQFRPHCRPLPPLRNPSPCQCLGHRSGRPWSRIAGVHACRAQAAHSYLSGPPPATT
mmetsp:Transcript_62486/g.112560  ORF Transcript_62486/g.112560 Transcript_62486/m.112560 type:complete len:212 (-) Transcript_62486:567-1202(-)